MGHQALRETPLLHYPNEMPILFQRGFRKKKERGFNRGDSTKIGFKGPDSVQRQGASFLESAAYTVVCERF
jgi:hypothetical protein